MAALQDIPSGGGGSNASAAKKCIREHAPSDELPAGGEQAPQAEAAASPDLTSSATRPAGAPRSIMPGQGYEQVASKATPAASETALGAAGRGLAADSAGARAGAAPDSSAAPSAAADSEITPASPAHGASAAAFKAPAGNSPASGSFAGAGAGSQALVGSTAGQADEAKPQSGLGVYQPQTGNEATSTSAGSAAASSGLASKQGPPQVNAGDKHAECYQRQCAVQQEQLSV